MELGAGKNVTPVVRLIRLLGKGGMSQVWVADHLELGMQVAVKFLSSEAIADDPTMAERFKREAELAAKIKSPHVVEVFAHGVTKDATAFIVMELLEGETLAQHIEDKGPLGLADAAEVITQTAKALSRAHRLGIVHRDIKPENLFLVESESGLFVKVLDFGIAKQTDITGISPVTTTGTMVGTPAFMSPEQVLSSKGVDHRSDLWSLAVVAYFVLTGRVPFTGQTLGSLCVAIAAGRYTPVHEQKEGLPMTLEFWFARALRINPDERFRSARDLALAFVEACGGSPQLEAEKFSVAGDATAYPGASWSADDFDFGDPPGPEVPGEGRQSLPDETRTSLPDARTLATRVPAEVTGASPAQPPPLRGYSRRTLAALAVGLSLSVAVVGVLIFRPASPTLPANASGSVSATTTAKGPAGDAKRSYLSRLPAGTNAETKGGPTAGQSSSAATAQPSAGSQQPDAGTAGAASAGRQPTGPEIAPSARSTASSASAQTTASAPPSTASASATPPKDRGF